uniref:Uncharacterized protein LOC111116039 isoform X2 n=1 Tax=Crassostrea virginica TaxID=6565 RepID=A0A8B8C6G5_CRAVI|nr:uncharacterized protein LOC111116039 isoform X2 [Crassostrea virginica]
MNFPAATFLVLMVSTCVMSHFHTGQAPVAREEMMNLLQRNMVPRGRSGATAPDIASRSTVPRLLNKPRRVLQPVVIRPHITQPRQGHNEEHEMQQFMQLLPLFAMTEAGEGMADMMLPMMLMQRNGLF